VAEAYFFFSAPGYFLFSGVALMASSIPRWSAKNFRASELAACGEVRQFLAKADCRLQETGKTRGGTMRKSVFCGIACFLAIAASGQTIDKAAVQQALQRIAASNATVENVIYDGMCYEDACKVFGQKFEINIDFAYSGKLGIEFGYVSRHGNFSVFWSSYDEFSNPVVIGYCRTGTTVVKHNRL
jgi:hypothetical protein